MARGKNYKVDSFRISQYGEEKIKRLKPDKPLNKTTLLLRQLLSYSKRLVRESAGLAVTIKERNHMYDVHSKDPIVRISKDKIKTNRKHIIQLQEEIILLIRSDASFLQNFRILTSIKGIGPIKPLLDKVRKNVYDRLLIILHNYAKSIQKNLYSRY